MTRRQAAWIALLLLVAAVLLRLPSLNSFLTPDEQRIWTTLTAQFLAALLEHDWAATATSGYPGVTTTWASSLGLALQWLLARPAGVTTLAGMADALLADPARLDMLVWMRLGVALASAAGIVLVFGLARRLFDGATALLAAGVLLFDPFLLAHTRLLNTDPLLALALTVSWLALVIGAGSSSRRYLALSGAAFGLALLTKTPALLVAPLVLLWIFWQRGHRERTVAGWLRGGCIDLAWFTLPALVTAVVAWPALWVAPLTTLRRSVEFAAALAQTGHELGNFWLGQAVEGPGVLFYPAVALWRSTPATLIGAALATLALLSAGANRLRSATRPAEPAGHGAATALLLFIVWFAAAMSLSPKKFDRYLLPVFPMIDLLAAWGWVTAVRWAARARRRGSSARRAPPVGRGWVVAVAAVVVGVQATCALSHLPTYLPAYNPLLGGIRTAQRVMLVGWGEGLEQAAAYLNRQPDAENTRVAAWYGHNVFAPFFRGQSYDLYYDLPTAADLYANDVDFVVTYINQRQRGLLDDSVQDVLGAPVMSSEWRGALLAQVFPWPKPFAHTADRELAPGLRLLGWSVAPYDATTGHVQVTLAWDAAGAAAAGALPPVTVWIKDASGEVWATDQGVGKISETVPAWLDHQAIQQTLTLSPPAGLLPGDYQVEMAVSGGDGQTLGRVTLPATPIETALPAEVIRPDQPVVFDAAVQLVGYEMQPAETGWQIDLLWGALAPPPEAQFFVHLMDAAGQMVAQHDGPLPTWPAGALARERVHLTLLADQPSTAEDFAIYVGLYRPATGERLPLAVGGQDVPDQRYELP